MVENQEAQAAPAPVKLGIDNLKKVVALVCSLAEIGDKIGHETGTARWSNLLDLIGTVKGISGLDWKQVGPEIKDLDATERAQLEQYFKENFTLIDKELEAVIEKGIVLAEKQAALVQEMIDYSKELKAV